VTLDLNKKELSITLNRWIQFCWLEKEGRIAFLVGRANA